MKSFKYVSLGIFLMLFSFGCSQKQSNENEMDESMNNGTNYTKAVAVVHPTEGNTAMGTVTFEKVDDGIQVHAEFKGLSEGMHGFHIHLYGDCTASDGTSAGTHFNFEGSSLNPPADIDRITGNLGNLNANADGEAIADTLIANAVLNGAKSIIGRAVIVHEKANDPSQPPIGAAGSRLGCGVIGIANTGTE
ncbi:MAG: superoxide dismutase family protein [Balneolaceae bacterium]|jgi:Cu-Zn family superoxide dismutase